jgi:hypothetical protein
MNKRSVKKSRPAKASRSPTVRKVRKAAARKSPARKASARKSTSGKVLAGKTAASKPLATKTPARQTPAQQVVRQPERVASRPAHHNGEANGASIHASGYGLHGASTNGSASSVSVMDVLSRNSVLRAHKFQVGQTVFFTSSPITRPGASGSYKVVKLLPSDGDDYQYRIKNPGEAFERVAKESQLEIEL